MNEKKSARSLDGVFTLRGLACILVVFNHTIGGHGKGLDLDGNSILSQINLMLTGFRLPLFSFISGYLYSQRPVISGGYISYLNSKFKRFFYPLFFVAIPFEFFREVIKDGNRLSFFGIVKPLYASSNHYWFLQAMILIVISIVVIEKYQMFKSSCKCASVLVLLAVLYLVIPGDVVLFSFSGFVYIFPFFLFGNFLGGNEKLKIYALQNKWLFLALNFFTIVVVYGLHNYYLNIGLGLGSLAILATGISGCLLLYSFDFKSLILSRIGMYSMTIYLMHVYFTNIAAIIVMKFQIDSIISAVFGVALGVSGPILLAVALKKHPRAQRFILGTPLVKAKK